MTVQQPAQSPHLSFPRGAFIFREGEGGGFAYVVDTGTVEIVKSSVQGDVVLATVEDGGLFGEMAVIDGSPRSASARAATDVTVRELNRTAFLRHIQAKPDIALGMLSKLAGYVRSTNSSAAFASSAATPAATANDLPADDLAAESVVADTDAIYNAPPTRHILVASLALVAFLIISILFMIVSFVDTTVQGRGKITTRVPNVVVQASGNAAIESVSVERGEAVSKGQVIARLDGTFVTSNLTVVTERLGAVERRIERIRMEQEIMAGADPVVLAGRAARLDSGNHDILTKRGDEFRSRMTSFSAQLANLEAEIAAAKDASTISAEQLDLKAQIEKARETLYRDSVGSLLTYLNSRDDRLDARRRWQDAVNSVGTLQSRHAATVAEREAFVAHWSSTLAEHLAREVEARLSLTEEQVKLDRQATDLTVRAPVAGVVLDLPRVSAGSIVRAGEPLVTLVPSDVPLAVDVDIDPRDVSDVRLGAPVSVKLDALPFQQYGDLPGRLIFVSDDTHSESLFGSKGAFYRARVELLPEATGRLPPGFRLTPGMLVTADLKVGERRLITYFINPVIKNLSTAFHEPD